MAEYYGYFNGLEYGEEFVSLVNKILVKNGVFDNGLIVSAGSGMTVQSASGAAIIDGFIYYNDESKELVLSPANGSLPRIDSVMLRWDIPNRKMNLIVVTGTAQSNPSAPAPIRDNTYYDLQIATIRVNAGAASITAANITDTRPDSEVCGITAGYNSVDIDAMMTQYTSQFGDWFEQIKGQLDEDAAGNLQNQIDGINMDVPKWNSIGNPNYLINGDSQVWQRGESFTLTRNNPSWQYCDDRWRYKFNSSSGTAVISKNEAGGTTITISGTGTVTRQQVLERNFSGTLTTSVNGVLTSNTFSGTIVEQTFTATSTVNWTKLEAGNVSTPFSPRPYREELDLCRWYYRELNGGETISSGYINVAGTLAYIPIMFSMRVLPTFTVNNLNCYRIRWDGGEPFATSMQLTGMNESYMTMTVGCIVTGRKAAALYHAVNGGITGKMTFDAEIYS